MTSEFDYETGKQHVCTNCYRYFWTVEKYDVDVNCPYCGGNPTHPDLRQSNQKGVVARAAEALRGDK